MPQIPGLPIDEPVAQPYAKPQLFGEAGDTVAGVGIETERMAQGTAEFEGHLAAAQRQLHAKQAQISFEQKKNQVYNDLQHATTVEDAQAIYDHGKEELDNTLAPYQGDRVLSRQLGIYRQQEDVEIQHTVNAKKAEIVTHADKAANQVIGEKAMQQGIAESMAGGDAGVARKQYEMTLQSSVAHGTLLPEQAEADLHKWDQDLQVGVVEAYINNPDPAKRREAINQLKSGGKGPIDLSALNQGEINRLYTHAVDTDHNLSIKDEAATLNTALNIAHDAFQAPPYKDNFDLQKQALDDSNWLKEHGIVTGEGQPDRVMADKLKRQIEANESDFDRAAKHKADSQRDEIYGMFAKGDISGGMAKARQYLPDFQKAKVDYYPQIVNQSKSWMAEQRAESRAAHSLSNEDKQLARQEKLDSFATLGQVQLNMQNGRDYSDQELYGMIGKGPGKMSSQQVHDALQLSHSIKKDPDDANFYKSISSQEFAPGVLGELNSEFADYLRKNPNATPIEKGAAVQRITDSANVDRVNSAIEDVQNKLNGDTGDNSGGLTLGNRISLLLGYGMKPQAQQAASGDYDIAGYEKEFGQGSYAAKVGKEHFPDTYKNPSHITFSTDSKYSKSGQEGGSWKQVGSTWHFTPSQFNLSQHSIQEYMHYFDTTEKGSVLEIDKGGKKYKYVGNDKWQLTKP